MKAKRVKQLDNEYNYMFDYKSISQAARITGINRKSITECCSGRTKTAGGYIWVYTGGK